MRLLVPVHVQQIAFAGDDHENSDLCKTHPKLTIAMLSLLWILCFDFKNVNYFDRKLKIFQAFGHLERNLKDKQFVDPGMPVSQQNQYIKKISVECKYTIYTSTK